MSESEPAEGVSEETEAPNKKKIYRTIICGVFSKHHRAGIDRFTFKREELFEVAQESGVSLGKTEKVIAKNIGDIIYTYRFRQPFPQEILDTAPEGKMWVILGKGIAVYEFRLITDPCLAPDKSLPITKVHDATPEIVKRFNLSDEQAILARVRYNRLIDMFAKCVAYSLQNHLRTTIKEIGQFEVDELYVGSNRQGEHFIIPVQFKRLNDKLGVSQLFQDLELCRLKYPEYSAKAIGAQSLKRHFEGKLRDVLVMFELSCHVSSNDVTITKICERHFLLLPSNEITGPDFEAGKKWKDDCL